MGKENHNKFILVLAAAGVLALVFSFIVPQPTINYPQPENLFGYAQYDSPDYSDPSPGFTISHDVITFTQPDEQVQFKINVNDDFIYHRGYISLDGSSWSQFIFSESNLFLDDWILDSTETGFTFTPSDLGLGPGVYESAENYVIIFSCTDGSPDWDCYEMQWQLHQFTGLYEGNVPTCVDSDFGINYTEFGIVTINSGSGGAEIKEYPDRCGPTNIFLKEYYCDGDAVAFEDFDCTSIGGKCSEGVCIFDEEKTGGPETGI